jgi:hypothetical protein
MSTILENANGIVTFTLVYLLKTNLLKVNKNEKSLQFNFHIKALTNDNGCNNFLILTRISWYDPVSSDVLRESVALSELP